MAVASRREPMAPAIHADHLTDVLHGLNVRHWNYLDLDALAKQLAAKEAERKAYYCYPWDDFVPQWCWVVYIWDDGLDYDADGNSYWDSPPDYYEASYHLTQKGAEVEAAHWEDRGIKPHNIRVCEGWQDQLDYDKPILP